MLDSGAFTTFSLPIAWEMDPTVIRAPAPTSTNDNYPIIQDLCENHFAVYVRVELLGNLVYLIWKYTAKLLSRTPTAYVSPDNA